MKKTGIFLLGLFSVSLAFAQPAKQTSAFNANKDGKFEDAATYIEEAASDPKVTAKEKYWRYRGDIYLNIAKDPALSAKYPKAMATASESYFKGMGLDAKGDYANEYRAGLGDLQSLLIGKAEVHYNAEDFCNAADEFIMASEISKKYNIVDSAFIFNAGFCYDRCGNAEKALAAYKYCGELGYKVPDVYNYSSEIYTKAGQREEALRVLSDARAKYPKDANLLRSEVNIYLNDGSYDKAESLLLSLTETDPSNESIWFVLGVTYEKLNKKDQEEAAYKKALELKPDYYDALFNLGAMYFNDGLEKEKICIEIPTKERAKYEDCMAGCKTLYVKATEQLEKAYSLNDKEKEVISALKDAYYKCERMEDYARMKALLK
jgi:tetratricopeptide (TPR) repeat protein